MGDTLTHLADRKGVDEVLAFSTSALSPAGILVLTFRDYTQALRDEGRFIPVKSDDHLIMTCFLEFHESTVGVHDISARTQRWNVANPRERAP